MSKSRHIEGCGPSPWAGWPVADGNLDSRPPDSLCSTLHLRSRMLLGRLVLLWRHGIFSCFLKRQKRKQKSKDIGTWTHKLQNAKKIRNCQLNNILYIKHYIFKHSVVFFFKYGCGLIPKQWDFLFQMKPNVWMSSINTMLRMFWNSFEIFFRISGHFFACLQWNDPVSVTQDS